MDGGGAKGAGKVELEQEEEPDLSRPWDRRLDPGAKGMSPLGCQVHHSPWGTALLRDQHAFDIAKLLQLFEKPIQLAQFQVADRAQRRCWVEGTMQVIAVARSVPELPEQGIFSRFADLHPAPLSLQP